VVAVVVELKLVVAPEQAAAEIITVVAEVRAQEAVLRMAAVVVKAVAAQVG
jgi:hypothetical protein